MEEKKNNIADKFNVFKKIVEITSKHGKLTTLFSVVILFFVYNILINPVNVDKYLDRYTDKQEDIHKEGLLKRQQADNLIPSILDVLRFESGADRVMLLEFHNGSQNSADLPFYHFSATYESIDSGNDSIDYINDQYRNQNAGNYNIILQKIKRDRYIYSSDIELDENNKIVRKMEKNDVDSYYICAVYNDSNQVIAILAITSNHINGLDENQLNRITPGITHRISNLISGINNK